MIMEKQKNLEGASNHYEMAWKISNNSSSSIGYLFKQIPLGYQPF